MNIRKLLLRLINWNYLSLIIIVIVILGMHLYSINQINKPIFDENYYIIDAKSIIDHQGTLRPEHPPLGKLFIAAGIHIFGDNPVGWRFSPVIFGVSSIILFFFICRKLKLSWETTNIATFLFGFENLSFIQANLAMLDVFCLTFMLATILFYLRGNYYLAGLLAGLAILSKLPGIMVLGIIFLYWLFINHGKWKGMLITMITAVLSFTVLLPLLEYSITSTWDSPLSRLSQMMSTASILKFDSGIRPFVSQPWEWLMNYGILFYSYKPQYIGMINPTITIMVIPCFVFLCYKGFKRDPAAILSLIWFFCSYISWILISLIFHRLMYIYYFYPVIGSICLGTGLIISKFKDFLQTEKSALRIMIGKWVIRGCLVLHLVIFLFISPLMPGLAGWLRF
jgi:dolichyl-phosphate-mannose-protein mannosyltransferase